MNLFEMATRGVNLDALPDEDAPRPLIDFGPNSGPSSRVAVPTELNDLFDAAASEYGVDPTILKGIAWAESRFRPDVIDGTAKSSAGALGMMQFMPATAKEMGINPLDPVEAVFGAAAYLRESLDKFGGDTERAIASYNWGRNRAAFDRDDWYKSLPAETRNYVGTVLEFADGVGAGKPQASARQELPDGVKPSQAGAGRGVINPATARQSPAIPDMTAGSVAQDIASGALQIGPTAIKGMADLARLVTGDRVGKDTSDAMEHGMQSIRETVGSERAAAQREKFQQDIADGRVGIGQALWDNKGALADQILPTLGSMLLPVGAAGLAGKAATAGKAAAALDTAALAARVTTAQKAAGIGATAAQNAADVFAGLVDKGYSLEDAYKAAGITVPFSVIAGKLTGGGAEVALARQAAGQGAKTGALGVLKGAAREGAQEVGEELGQVTGEAVGTGVTPDATTVGKRLAVAGTLGAVVGGGVDVAGNFGATPRVEDQPVVPIVPPVAQRQEPTLDVTYENADGQTVTEVIRGNQSATPQPDGAAWSDVAAADKRARAETEVTRKLAEVDGTALPARQPQQAVDQGIAAQAVDNIGALMGATPGSELTAPPADVARQVLASEAATPAAPEVTVEQAEQQLAQREAPVQPVEMQMRPTGTLLVKGDAAALRERLAAAGVDNTITVDGGLIVAKSQAARAQQALSTTAATPQEKFNVSQDPVPQTQPAAQGVGAATPANPGAQSTPTPSTPGAAQGAQGRVVLQNRNRATPSSVAQMRSIAANPDYGRLGFSRDFANGAPVVAGSAIPAAQLGRQDTSSASDGRRIPIQYAVVDAGAVLTSNRADGTTNPDYGNPGIQALRAIAGNGRIAGLQAAYEGGNAATYRQEMAQDAALHGIDPAVIARMAQPVLVRVMPDGEVTPDIGDVSNTVGNLDLSAVEQANNDANRVTLDALQFAEDGSVTTEVVRQFVRAMPQSEQGQLLDTNGQPTRQAVDRLNAAVFAKAYSNEALTRLYSQAQDPEARLVMSALAQVAPKMARLEGAGALDVRDVVAQAAEIAVNARRQGIAIAKAAQQLDMAADPDVGVVLDLFASNSRTVRPVVEALGRMADLAYTEATKPADDMFGAVPRADRATIINELRPENERGSQKALEDAAGRGPAQVDDGGQTPEPAGPAAPAEPQAGRPADAAVSGQEQAGDLAGLLELSSYTAQEVTARQEAQAEADQARERDAAQAERRAQADANRDTFTLTGSDRAADVLEAQGQAPMFSRSPGTRAAYEARIDALFSGEKAKTGTRILDSSDVMGLLGYPKVPLMLNESHLRDGLTNHPEMTAAAWKNVPQWIENPAAVYTDPRNPGRLTLIAPETLAGYPVVMVIEPNPNPAGSKAKPMTPTESLLVTAYAKTTGGLPGAGMLALGGHLKYMHTQNAPEIWRRGGGQFPKQAALSQGRHKILTEKQLGGYRRANGPAFSFAGSRAATADMHALVTAQDRLDAGEDPETVRQETGWHRGTDGRMRFEISDADALLKADTSGAEGSRTIGQMFPLGYYGDEVGLTVGRMLHHPALFAAYPAIADIKVKMVYDLRGDDVKGSFNPTTNTITLNQNASWRDAMSTLLHEIQHGIQGIEGFATGGSVDFARGLLAQEQSREFERTQRAWYDSRARWPGAYDSIMAVRMLDSQLYDKYGIQTLDKDGNNRKSIVLGAELRERISEPDKIRRRDAQSAYADAVDADLGGFGSDLFKEFNDLYNATVKALEGQPQTALGVYKRLAGEVEARNTQARQNMTDAERRTTSPGSTADVADSDVIVTFNGKEMQNAPAPANAGQTTNPDIRFSRTQATKAAYEARIDALFSGEKPRLQGARVLDRSDMLAFLGFGDGPVNLSEGKVVVGKDNHPHMTAAVWKKIPEWLENPALVFDSDTTQGRLVFIAPEMVNGSPVRIIVEPNAAGGVKAHLLVNAYDAKGGSFRRWESDGLLRYVDRNKYAHVSGSFQPQLAGLPGDRGRRNILTDKQYNGWRRANTTAYSQEMSPELANTLLAIRRPATKESVRAAVRELVNGLGLLPNRLGRVVVATAAEIQQDWEPLIGPVQLHAEQGGDGAAQGFYDPNTRTVFLIADHIRQGDELGVVAHELMHKHGQAVLGAEGWGRLHSTIERWADAPANSTERQVYDEAVARVEASQPDTMSQAQYSSQELFPYAVQVAMEMGIQPSAAKPISTVAGWLAHVKGALRRVWDKITSKPEAFDSQDLVNLAFGIAQRENPQHQGELDNITQGEAEPVHGEDATKTSPEDAGFDEPLMFSRATAEKNTLQWRDETGRLQFAPGQWLYDRLGDAASPMLTALGLKSAYPELRRQLRQMKLQVQRAQELSAKVAKEAAKLSAADRAMVSDLVEKDLQAGTIPPEHAVKLAAIISTTMEQQSKELVELGMLTKEAAERWEGTYLPRFYESKLTKKVGDAWADAMRRMVGRPRLMKGIGGKHLKGRGIFETIDPASLPDYQALGWEVRDPDYVPGESTVVQVWRDFNREERAKMGEIRDAGFRFVMGYMQTQKDIALGRMFQSLANDERFSSRLPTKEMSVRVPDTKVEGTGANVYGKLAGRYVSQETLSHLSSFDEVHNDTLQMYRQAMSLWKEGKTVLNPVAHMNNVVSNLTMAHLAGISYHRGDKYLGALADFLRGSPMIEDAKDAGLFLGSFNQAELLEQMPDELKKLVSMQESTGAKTTKTAMAVMTWALRKPLGMAYEFEDSFFKYLLYKDARQRGLEQQDAIDYAQRYIFTYDDLPKGARRIRDFGIPFFAYTYKAVPALLHTAMAHPVRIAMPAALLWTATALSYAAMADGDDDTPWPELAKKYLTDADFREKAAEARKFDQKHLPTWMRGSTAFFTPKTMRVGYDKVMDLPVFMDISRFIPGGDLFDVTPNAGGLPLPQPITPNHPLLTMAMGLLGNKDLFTGKELVDKNDTKGEAAEKRAAWIYRQVAPAVAVGQYHWNRGMEMVAQASGGEITWLPELVSERYTGIGSDGLPVLPQYGIPQTFGIKIRPMDQDKAAQIERAIDEKLIRSIDAEIKQLVRLNSSGILSDKAFEKRRDFQREKRDRLKNGHTVDGDEKE